MHLADFCIDDQIGFIVGTTSLFGRYAFRSWSVPAFDAPGNTRKYNPLGRDTCTLTCSQAYTILESSTKSLFLHMTMSEPPAPYWGTILKSNSNGTYFGISIENVNRNTAGYVDFEKMVGLDGIALINVVSNPEEAVHSGRKAIQSRITHNDGMLKFRLNLVWKSR